MLSAPLKYLASYFIAGSQIFISILYCAVKFGQQPYLLWSFLTQRRWIRKLILALSCIMFHIMTGTHTLSDRKIYEICFEHIHYMYMVYVRKTSACRMICASRRYWGSRPVSIARAVPYASISKGKTCSFLCTEVVQIFT